MRLTLLFLVANAICGYPCGKAWAASSATSADIVVYGATTGGLFSAIAALREGVSVIVLEPETHLGGMVTSGLGVTDKGRQETIGGMAADFYRRIHDRYEQRETWRFERKEDFLARLPPSQMPGDGKWWMVEPRVATVVLQELLDKARVTVLTRHRLAGVIKRGGRIISLQCENGAEFSARIFIDATYEGDLMAKAGVSYRTGRESAAEYGEPFAGVVPHKYSTRNQVDVNISPYDEKGRLIHGIQAGERGEDGAGDRKIQAYNYRLCLTTVAENRVPITRPDRYNPSWYEMYARYFAAKPGLRLANIIGNGRVPNGKTDLNGSGPFATDIIGFNWDYPDGDHATREAIVQYHADFTKGLLYFLGHDERVPVQVRDEMNQWGYAADEFRDTGHFPPQLYVREARRMVGAYVMTSDDISKNQNKSDSVGIASYKPDSHIIQRIVDNGFVRNEGNPNDFTGSPRPYEVPYRAITPKAAECENLLVTFCVSASHMAFASLRMEPVFMILSQSAGLAAVQALRAGSSVQSIDVPALQKTLRLQCQLIKLKDVASTKARTL